MKLFYFLAGAIAGTAAYLVCKGGVHAPDPDTNGELHTFNINELVGENSMSLQELKERLEK
jgi:hypothetical protein